MPLEKYNISIILLLLLYTYAQIYYYNIIYTVYERVCDVSASLYCIIFYTMPIRFFDDNNIIRLLYLKDRFLHYNILYKGTRVLQTVNSVHTKHVRPLYIYIYIYTGCTPRRGSDNIARW